MMTNPGVKEKPIGKLARPLFPSMTYHDTPSQPMPQMRYVDTSAKAGEKHSYSIVSVQQRWIEIAAFSPGVRPVTMRASTALPRRDPQ